MTLTTHAVVGASAAELFPEHPLLAFIAGFTSHFLIDAIPHWDYRLLSGHIDEKNPLNSDIVVTHKHFPYDLVRVAGDAFLGMLLSMLIFSPANGFPLAVTALGAIGGILPDPLQFIYFKFRREPIRSLQRFHEWIHTTVRLRGRYIAGASLQIALVAAAVLLTQFTFTKVTDREAKVATRPSVFSHTNVSQR